MNSSRKKSLRRRVRGTSRLGGSGRLEAEDFFFGRGTHRWLTGGIFLGDFPWFPADFLGIFQDFLGIFWGFSGDFPGFSGLGIQRFKENWGRVSELRFFCGTSLCFWFEDSLTQCVKYAAKHDGKNMLFFLNRQPTPFHLSDVSSEAMLGQRSSGTAGIREGRCGRGRWEGSFQQVWLHMSYIYI